MGENAIGNVFSYAAAVHTAVNSVQALGRGFDVNLDTRLLYCKGIGGSRLVQIDEEHTKDLYLYDDVELLNVSRDINKSMESQGRQSSGVKSFHEVWCVNYPVCLFFLCLLLDSIGCLIDFHFSHLLFVI